MALINWSDNLSVNIKGLDNQHKKLVSIINELHDAMKKGESSKVLTKILFEMAAYTKTHFKSEEELFDKYNYPDKIKHKKEHDMFVKKVDDFMTEYKSGKTNISFELMNFLTKWLTNHIQVSDKAYSGFLNKNGIY
ncbi:MAG: bacteriohemerythrin [Melioribacter sp.]|uniref:bacteriohemerythrin n=1 Tax=Rosettibacter primus TaxID=3111523 RepID=UPI00247BACA7|nr:bacteriohemerythrin [Melioribacter sp.]